MKEIVWDGTWYLAEENTRRRHKFTNYDDQGSLLIRDEELQYKGGHTRLQILHSNIRRVSFGKQKTSAAARGIS